MKTKKSVFHFKQFSVSDQNSALKTGTDAVLLGAWTQIKNIKTILDIGCGSGIIALMLAQRNPKATIIGIDNHEGSIKDAKENFSNSQWKENLKAIEISWLEYLQSCEIKYDVIISNPPFFIDSLKSPYSGQNISKHTDTINPEIIINSAKKLLSANGQINLILPFDQKDRVINAAISNGYYINRECEAIPKPGKKANRLMLELKITVEKVVEKTSLIIRNEDNSYTSQYKSLTRDFYQIF
jgi:tRNA1Val (adenine37-N6)-methyltransferase